MKRMFYRIGNAVLPLLAVSVFLGAALNFSACSTASAPDDSGNSDETDGIQKDSWLSDSVPSIYKTFAEDFEYVGIAAEYGNFGLRQSGADKYTASYTQSGWGTPGELYYDEVQKGIAKHANSLTLGNEMKPQFLLAWWNTGDGAKQQKASFEASNGKTVEVPAALNNENLIYATLNVAKKMGVKMRGHVLTWHSQTPDDFFAEGYSAKVGSDGLLTNPVDKETMTARHEWYIKTVLECVAAWEEANGYGDGNHIIWAWDVVNEACADDASDGKWYRGDTAGTKDKKPENSGSRWYQIYGSDEFIVNAFRFANAYAPADVKLCYNDYNEYMPGKTAAIEHLVKAVQNGSAGTVGGKSVSPRIDVVAMQSHLGTEWPGVSSYESALKKFLALGCDVHVSELDFSAESEEAAVKAYGEYFSLFRKYGKSWGGANRITSVTVWGINNENSWINPSSYGKKVKTYPLLFNLDNNVDGRTKTAVYDTGTEKLPLFDEGDSYIPNKAFWAVIKAAK